MDLALSGYQEALDFLFARTTGASKFGLERTTALLRALGDPHRRLRALHVAGTNGKGSVCATLEAVLRARGLRVGKYTSPHLVDFRERITIDGRAIAADAVVEWVARWTPECERLGATFFEATTAMAFDYFAREAVDVAVIETGLGGRLDSTNVIAPLVACVTSIGIDHVEYLGDTVEAIADEKAGIFKPDAAAVIGEVEPAIAAHLAQRARERGARTVRVVADECRISRVAIDDGGTRFTIGGALGEMELRTPLIGEHQARNAVCALVTLDAAGPALHGPSGANTLAALRAGLETVRLPGRFQRVGQYLFDVAHNPDGAAVLADSLLATAPPRPVVALLSVLDDKDWRGMIAQLARAVDHFVLTTAPTSPAARRWDAASAHAFTLGRGWSAEVEMDFDRALERARATGATVLVTGSFHTVGDAMARLQVSPLDG